MYPSHWGLQESPFRNCLDPRFFYQSPTHDEALARMHFLVEQRRRLGVLLGVCGSGKSMLLEVFAEQLRRLGTPAARISLQGLAPDEFLGQLATSFQLNPSPDESRVALWRMVTDRLSEYRYQQVGTAILLDEADTADEQVLSQVSRLAAFDLSSQSGITILLAAQPERLRHLGTRLLELAELRIDVEPWQQSDTEDYLSTSLSQAGRESPVFDAPAVTRLHELSHGIPRRVSRLADLSLLAGAGAELEEIGAEVVESVYSELGLIEV